MTRWLREPLLSFFLVGAGLFLAYRLSNPRAAEEVVLGDAGVAILTAEYEALTGATPDADRRRELIDDYFRREVLYREGLRAGIHESDPVLREVMIDRMQQRVAGELPKPTGRDLVNFYADNIERYYAEATISVSQRFLRRAPESPDALLRALQAGNAPPFDPPPGGGRLPAYGESMLRALFGNTVLEALRSLPPGTWSGPFESSRGWHFFRVDARGAPAPLPFEEVQQQVRADWLADVIDRRLADFVDARRSRYRLQLRGAGGPPP